MRFLTILFFLIGSVAYASDIDYKSIPITDGNNILLIHVSKDYYEVNDVRTPLSLSDAVSLALKNNAILPTPKIVDEIYYHGDLVLNPHPLPPGPEMTSVNYYTRHDELIDQEVPEGFDGLIVGHKKDLVFTTRLEYDKGKVAIYGWHRRDGSPIQPLSLVHGANYYDYSHGVRLVANDALLNGNKVKLTDLLNSPNWSYLVSYESPFTNSMKLFESLK